MRYKLNIMFNFSIQFLNARRYASAGTSYGPVSVSLCMPQVGVLSKRINESGWFFWHGSFLPTLSCKEIQVPSKIKVLPSGTLLQTLDLENFATAYRSSKRVVNLARERWTLGAEADLGMFSMFGRTGTPTKRGPHKRTLAYSLFQKGWPQTASQLLLQ